MFLFQFNEASSFELRKILPRDLAKYLTDDDSFILDYHVKKNNRMFIREKPIVDHLMYQDYLARTREDIKESTKCTFVVTNWAVVRISRAFVYSKNFKYQRLFDAA